MSIEHTCPSCQIRLRVADESAGKKVRCKCGAVSIVTASGSATASSAMAAPSGAGQPILLTCGNCQQTLRAPHTAAGKAVRCKCGQVVQVPGAQQTAAARPSVAARAAATRPATAQPVTARPAAASTPPVAARQATPMRAAGTAAASTAVAAPVAAPVRAAPRSAAPAGSIFDELTDADWNRESPIKRAYAPPTASKDGAFLKQFAGPELKAAAKTATPGGLIALSVFNFFGSAFCIVAGVAIVALVQVASLMDQLENVIPSIRLAATFFSVYLIAWGIYLAVVGVGLLQQAPWGWYVASVAYSYSIVDKLYAVISTVADGDVPAPRIAGMMGPVLFVIGVTSYLYKADTRRHFGLKTMTPVIVCTAIGVVLSITVIVVIILVTQSAESMIPEDAAAG